MSLLHVDADSMSLCLSFLNAVEIICVQLVCRAMAKAAVKDPLWVIILARELCIISTDSELILPPSNELLAAVTNLSLASEHGFPLIKVYSLWRSAYLECNSEEIGFMRQWWIRMHAWLRNHAPIILNTLNPPPSAVEVSRAENVAAFPIPRLMHLFYSFHNGQNNNQGSENYSGLFGGYELYDQSENNLFLPLIDAANLCNYILRERSHKKGSKVSFKFHDIHSTPADDWSRLHAHDKLWTFSCSRSSLKLICSGSNDHVYVNFDRDNGFVSCVDPLIVGTKAGFILWLDEYMRRLEKNTFRYEPINLTEPSAVTPQSPQRICLFPYSSLSAITRGIEVSPSVIFIPNVGRETSRSIFCAYTMRMRAIPEQMPMKHCQLIRRHWRITSGDAVEQVDGEGVIGLYPSFDKNHKEMYHFAYQSCTHSDPMGSMEGEFDFVVGTISNPGEMFQVAVPRFALAVSSFIF